MDLDGWNADTDGHGLAVFAAGAYAFVELQIVADHRYACEDVRAVADQRGAPDGSGDLAIFDHVGFGRPEDKLSVGDIDLSPAEVHSVHTALHGANNVFGIVLAREHVGVGHA